MELHVCISLRSMSADYLTQRPILDLATLPVVQTSSAENNRGIHEDRSCKRTVEPLPKHRPPLFVSGLHHSPAILTNQMRMLALSNGNVVCVAPRSPRGATVQARLRILSSRST